MNKRDRNGQEPGDKWAAPALAIVAAGIFGVGYNHAVATLNRRGWSEGYTSLLVVAGSGVLLLLAAPIIGVRKFLALFGIFAAGGTPMVIGDVTRYASARQAAHVWLGTTGDDYGNEGEWMANPRQRGGRP